MPCTPVALYIQRINVCHSSVCMSSVLKLACSLFGFMHVCACLVMFVQVEGQWIKDRKTGQPKTTVFTAKGLSKMGADQYMFDYVPNRDAEPRQISVAEHFERNLNIRLEYPKYPCVVVCTTRLHTLQYMILLFPCMSCCAAGSCFVSCAGVVCEWLYGAGQGPYERAGHSSAHGAHESQTWAEEDWAVDR